MWRECKLRRVAHQMYQCCLLLLLINYLIINESRSANVGAPILKFRNVAPGLSNDQIKIFFQDKIGFLWIGTLGGLHKYDGSDITLYLHDPSDEYSLPFDRVEKIFEDSRGRLWIGTSDGLCQYDRTMDRFVRFPVISGLIDPSISHPNRIMDIHEDEMGTIWIASNREGLLYFDEDLNSFESLLVEEDVERFETLQFTAFEIDKNGVYWLATFGHGLYKLNPRTRELNHLTNDSRTRLSLGGNLINDITIDHKNRVWVGTDRNGVDLITQNQENLSIQHFRGALKDEHALVNDDITTIYLDRSDRIWVCNENGGLHLYDEELQGFHRYLPDINNPSSISSISIWTIYEDLEGRLWVGTSLSGIDVCDPYHARFEHYYASPVAKNGLSSNVIRQFYETTPGEIWLATDGGGLNRFDVASEQFESYQTRDGPGKGPNSDAVISLEIAPDGKLWLGTWAGGVNILDLQTMRFSKLKCPDEVDLTNVFHIKRDKHDNMWLASHGGGLVCYDWKQKKFRSYKKNPTDTTSIGENELYSLIIDSKENVWLAVRNGGLNVLTKENRESGIFKRFLPPPRGHSGLPSIEVNQVYEDRNGTIWAATNRGLARYIEEEERFEVLDSSHGLPSDNIRSLIEDDRGFYWIRSIEAISRYNPETGEFKNFTTADGVQKGNFLRHSLYKRYNGELLFSGSQGFNRFHPDSLIIKREQPRVYLTDFELFNESVPISEESILKKHISETESITLTREQWKIRFEFVAINFTRAENNQYAYMMEGLEDQWYYAGNQRSATYTNLPAGTYTFRVKAANNEGVWNEEGTSVQVIVLEAWWQTWWANLLSLVLLGVLIWLAIKIRTYRLRRNQQKLEVLVESRTIELKKKNLEFIEQAKELARKNDELGMLNESMSMHAEELKTYNEALNEMNENLEKMVERRTRGLRQKNEELILYSFTNAHKVRGPLTRILGLLNLVNNNHDPETAELLARIKAATEEMDEITRSIGQKLDKQINR